MKHLIVGDKPCSFNTLVNLMEASSGAHIIVTDWKKLARKLDIPIANVIYLEQKLQIILNPRNVWVVVQDLLIQWRLKSGNEAKLSELIYVLETECGWKDVADSIWEKFKTEVNENTTWHDLDERSRAKALTGKVTFFGSEMSLEKVIENVKENERRQLLNDVLSGSEIVSLLNSKTIVISRDKIPEIPSFYISRNLTSRRRIDPKIFQKNCLDILMVDGIDLFELIDLAGNQFVDRSFLQRKKITARIMLLEFNEDFDEICQLANNTPAHLLNYVEGKLYWIRTHGNLHLVQENVHENQDNFQEMDFLVDIENSKHRTPVCIADSPGMGKSIMLAKLCSNQRLQYPGKFIAFADFNSILTTEYKTNADVTKNTFINWMSNYFADNNLGKTILKNILDDQKQQVQLFIDGFDEVPLHQLHEATKLLKLISSDFTNVQIFVTTRLHRREQLEQALSTLSYRILPFQEQDQVEYLKTYWARECGIPNNPNLEQFAHAVLKITPPISFSESEIAGIPLQCRMLAEMYEKDAKKHAHAESLKFGAVFSVESLPDIYRVLMNMRFAKIDPKKREIIIRFHQMTALDLLFPQFALQIHQKLQIEDTKLCGLDEVTELGLLVADEGQNKFQFLHRSYAEFILADFFAQQLKELTTSERPHESKFAIEILQLILKEVLQLSYSDRGIHVNTTDCLVEDAWKEMSKCTTAESCRRNWKALASALNMSSEDVTTVSSLVKLYSRSAGEMDKDVLYLLLWQWTNELTASRLLADLVDVLINLQFDEIADILKSRFYRKHKIHGNICLFLERCLDNFDFTLSPSVFKYIKNTVFQKLLETNFSNAYDICKNNLYDEYANLFKFVSNVFFFTKRSNSIHSDSCNWQNLLIEATKHSSLPTTDMCSKFVEIMLEIPVHEMTFKWIIFSSVECTPLHVACERGNISIFLFILSKFESRVRDMKCLLHSCTIYSLENSDDVIHQKLQIISKLLEINFGILEEREPERQRTPILMSKVHYRLLELLTEKGADIFSVDSNGYTVAHQAAMCYSSNDFHEFTTLVIKKGYGDVFKFCDETSRATPLQNALSRLSILPELLQLVASHTKTDFNNKDINGETEFFYAVRGLGSVDILKMIFRFGGDPNVRRHGEQTLVHVAAQHGHVEALEYFHSLGCNFNSRDIRGQTPLHLAITVGLRNVDQVVQLLLKNKADVSVVDLGGHSPLWYAEDKENSWKFKPSNLELLRQESRKRNLLQRPKFFDRFLKATKIVKTKSNVVEANRKEMKKNSGQAQESEDTLIHRRDRELISHTSSKLVSDDLDLNSEDTTLPSSAEAEFINKKQTSDWSVTDVVADLSSLISAVEFIVGWYKLAKKLKTPIIKIKQCEQDLLWNRKGALNIVEELLLEWKLRIGSDATLPRLIDIFEVECGWKEMAEHLENKYVPEDSEIQSWSNLSKRGQLEIFEKQVLFCGFQCTLLELLEKIEKGKREKVLLSTMSNSLILEILGNDVTSLTVDQVPERPFYYIPRLLSIKRKIDPNIFLETCLDVFAIENIEIQEFYEVSRGQQLTRSTQNLKTLTSCFILLELPEHFDKICEKSQLISVHWLKYENKNFFWKKSHGNCCRLQQYLLEDHQKIAEIELPVTQFIPGKSVCISGSPGWGKSQLLANLYRREKATNSHENIFFGKFGIIVEELVLRHNSRVKIFEIQCVLAQCFSKNALAYELLLEVLQNKQEKVLLFFDGLDEISVQNQQLAINVLDCLSKNFKNVRLFITTSVHMQKQLEQTLGVPSFTILPFSDEDLSNILLQYWSHHCGIFINENTRAFSSILISKVKSEIFMNDDSEAMTPLQCSKLAKIYELDAIYFANSDAPISDAIVKVNLVYDMYKEDIIMRLQNISPNKITQIKELHQMAALDVSFPEFSIINARTDSNEVKDSDIQSTGIMVVEQLTQNHQKKAFRFLSKLSTDYFVAEYLIDSLTNCIDDQMKITEKRFIVKLLFGKIFNFVEVDSGIQANTIECNIYSIWQELTKCSLAERCRRSWINVAFKLNISEEDINHIKQALRQFESSKDGNHSRDVLWWLLFRWTKRLTLQPPLSLLVDALCSLKFTSLAEPLKSKYFMKRFKYRALCYYLDNILVKNEDIEGILAHSKIVATLCFEELNIAPSTWHHLLETCVYENYTGLFRLISSICISLKSLQSFQVNEEASRDLINKAAKYTNVDLINECCTFVEIMEGKQLHQLKLENPLQIACYRGNLPVFMYLLRNFKDQICSVKGLLHCCIMNSSTDSVEAISQKIQIVEKLLELNFSMIDEVEPKSNKPAILATNSHFKLLENLISKGAKVFAVDPITGDTVAHLAASYLSPDDFHHFATILLEKGAVEIFSIHNKRKLNAVHCALQNINIRPDTVQLIISHGNTNFNNPDLDGKTELLCAIEGFQDKSILEMIIKHEGNPNCQKKNKQTVLHVAALCGHVEAIEYFVGLGCNLNMQDDLKQSPLHLAIRSGRKNVDQVVRLLIEMKADVNIVDSKGYIPLRYAESEELSWKLELDTLELLQNATKKRSLFRKLPDLS